MTPRIFTFFLISITAIPAALLALGEPPAECSPQALFGRAARYNLFVLEDIQTQESDTEGRVAVGRNASFTNYAIGQKLQGEDTLVDGARYTDLSVALAVGNHLTFQYGSVVNGWSQYAGTADVSMAAFSTDSSGVGTYALRRCRPTVSCPVDFPAAASELRELAARLGRIPENAAAQFQGARLVVAGRDPRRNVVHVEGSALANARELVVDVPATSTLLIVVTGPSSAIRHFGFQLRGAVRERMLWAFPDAVSLTIGNVGLQGSVVAPHAALQFDSGHIAGQVVVRSFKGNGQVNQNLFAGCLEP